MRANKFKHFEVIAERDPDEDSLRKIQELKINEPDESFTNFIKNEIEIRTGETYCFYLYYIE